MSYKAKYGALLDDIANEADRMAMSYFRGGAMGAERKRDGTVVTQADKRIEQMAIARVKSSGLPMDVVGEETSAEVPKSPATNGRARMIIDPIDGTEEFTRGIPTFGTLLGIEEDAEIVAGMVSAPALEKGARWSAYRGEGAWRAGQRLHVSRVQNLSESMIFTTGTGPSKDSKERAAVDLWMKEIAPSDGLRKWFGHEPEKWPEFEKRYRKELAEKKDLLNEIRKLESGHKLVTLLYGRNDEKQNQAVVLADVLKRKR